MFDENQIVQVKWNNTNREWYESKGYIYTKRYAPFDVLAKDLSPRSAAKVNMICDYCGCKYTTSYVVAMDGFSKFPKDACSHCAGQKTRDISLKRRAEEKIGLAQEVCKSKGYTLITSIDDYTDVKMTIEFICPKHGLQRMMLDSLIRGHECIKCSYEKRTVNLKHDLGYVKECIESVNGNKLLNLEDYRDTFTRNLHILCSCGNIFTTSFSNYTKYNVNTCYSCSCKESSGEKSIREFLEKENITYVQEKRFKDCRDNKPLPFDFYLPDYNCIIEFDGQQHFEETGFHNHKETVKHDKIKNEYCQSNDIHIVRIPYWEGGNIDKILVNELNL